MGNPTGFMEMTRVDPPKRPIADRIRDFREIELMLPADRVIQQAARCMDCGVPSCHVYGCPLTNRIPDWNDKIYKGRWKEALALLHATNNFPEITGRICPAPCEAACTLELHAMPVTIRHIELQIIERGFAEGWVRPEPPFKKTGKRVGVIGSGPAGLAAAQQLARIGHEVIVFEAADRPGGLLRYGIPDFKLEKWVLDRRITQLEKEGVRFETEVIAGIDLSIRYLRRSFDAILIAAGAGIPRDLDVPGRNLKGIHFAMEYLTQQNRLCAGERIKKESLISAKNKAVVVIGGGDTGSDCVGTARRQGARSIVQIEILPKPPAKRCPENPWPEWPQILRTSTSHEEGCERRWSVLVKAFLGEKGRVRAVRCVEIAWIQDSAGHLSYAEISGSEFQIPADLVLIAAGFLHTEHGPLVRDLDLSFDARGNLVVDPTTFMTSIPGIFAAGDAVTGASLVVRAIAQGRRAAREVDRYLHLI